MEMAPDIGGGIDAGFGDKIGGMMDPIKQAGASGQFTVNETGGQALLQAFKEMNTWVDENLARMDTLAQQPGLGTTSGAEAVKPYVQEVATDQQGFITMLHQFRLSLTDAEQGVRDAMRNYQAMDDGNAATYNV